MKSALSLTLIVSLVWSAQPVAAQDRMASTAGPIASAVTRLAFRLAADPQSETADPNWSRVRMLTPGAEIIVTLQGAPPRKRYFVAADGSDLTVLNLTDPALPSTATRGLRDLASNHPEYFTARKGAFVDREIRVGPDGVFMADRKVADFGQIVERVARSNVAEVRRQVRTRGSVGWAITGAATGFGLGFLMFVNTLDCSYDYGNCGALRLRRTAPLWLPVAGGLLGYHASHRKVGGVIYRAPAP
jgi:hypothetical protein